MLCINTGFSVDFYHPNWLGCVCVRKHLEYTHIMNVFRFNCSIVWLQYRCEEMRVFVDIRSHNKQIFAHVFVSLFVSHCHFGHSNKQNTVQRLIKNSTNVLIILFRCYFSLLVKPNVFHLFICLKVDNIVQYVNPCHVECYFHSDARKKSRASSTNRRANVLGYQYQMNLLPLCETTRDALRLMAVCARANATN